MSTVFKKSDEAQPEIIGASNNESGNSRGLAIADSAFETPVIAPGGAKPNQRQEVIGFAKKLPKDCELTPYRKPTEKEGKTRKPACVHPRNEFKATYYSDPLTPDTIQNAPQSMVGVGLNLGTRFFSIDEDSPLAAEWLESFRIEHNLTELPETFTVWSGREGRRARLFRLPPGVSLELKQIFDKSDSAHPILEFLAGEKYQNLYGFHPITESYQNNGFEKDGVWHFETLPLEWCKAIAEYQGSGHKTEKEPKGVTEIDTTDLQLAAVQTLLGFLEALESDEIDRQAYDLWLKVGMIIHSVDDTEKGLQIWDEWSKKLPPKDEKEPRDNPSYEPGVCEKKWASFDSEGDKLSIGSLYFWFNQESEKIDDPDERAKFQGGMAQVRNALSKKWTIESIPGAIAEFKELGLQGQSLELAIQRVAKDAYGSASEHNLGLVWDLYNQEEISEEDQKSFQDAYEEVQRTQNDLNLKAVDILGDDCFLPHQIDNKAESEGLIPGYLTTSLLTGAMSRLPKGLKMNFNQTAKTVPIAYTVYIGDASYGKGEHTRDATSPLQEIRAIEARAYKKAKKEREEALKEWKKLTKDQKRELYLTAIGQVACDTAEDLSDMDWFDVCHPEPQAPTRLHVLKKFTPERARSASAEDDQFGLLACPSELVTISQGSKYQGNTKTDVDEFLEAYDGEPIFTDLEGNRDKESGVWQMSLISGIQRKVFRSRFEQDDPNGFLSRCVFLPLDLPVMHIKNENPDKPDSVDLHEVLTDVYKGIDEVFQGVSLDNPLVLKPTTEAKRLWNEHSDKFEQEANEYMESCPAMLSWLRRQPERTARFAMIIHAFRIQQGSIEYSDRISADTMLKAIRLANWFRALMFKVYDVSKEQENPELLQLLTKLREKFIISGDYQIGEKIRLHQPKVRSSFKNPALVAKYGSKKAEILNVHQQIKCLNDLDKLGGFVKVGKDGNRPYFQIMK